MRNGVGAGSPHHDSYSGTHASLVPVASYARAAHQSAAYSHANARQNAQTSTDSTRANIARLFFDLRSALRVTPQQLALHLQTSPNTIAALEAGDFEHLPVWSETARIVVAYTALAGIDGRPVLAALVDTIRRSNSVPLLAPPTQTAKVMHTPAAQHARVGHQVEQPASAAQVQSAKVPKVGKILAAGTAFANGAKRLPAGALEQVRQRPQRALYAISMPLAVVLLLFNTSALEAAFSHVPRPVARVAQDVRSYFQVQFAPVREGLRWIEVDDPRRRRGDKLR